MSNFYPTLTLCPAYIARATSGPPARAPIAWRAVCAVRRSGPHGPPGTAHRLSSAHQRHRDTLSPIDYAYSYGYTHNETSKNRDQKDAESRTCRKASSMRWSSSCPSSRSSVPASGGSSTKPFWS